LSFKFNFERYNLLEMGCGGSDDKIEPMKIKKNSMG
jgi:hypothetical protein